MNIPLKKAKDLKASQFDPILKRYFEDRYVNGADLDF